MKPSMPPARRGRRGSACASTWSASPGNSAARILGAGCVVLALVHAPAFADSGEAIFRQAGGYTAQVRATVSIPFDGDRKGSALGAGFLVDRSRGWIMTNAHVVSRSPARIEVAFQGREFGPAHRVYVDPFLDLAIVEVPPAARAEGLAEPDLECDALPRIGHPVGAFGHPWRLPFTGTRGIVSGVTGKYETELLQTDAPINQGNSGGPLISLETGRIVGINTASIVARGAQNTNFAVAMKYACRVLRLLQQGKDPSPPDLGVVYFKDIDNRRQLKVAKSFLPPGALDLRPGDLIRSAGNDPVPVENETQLVHELRGRLDRISIAVSRGGRDQTVTGTLPPEPPVLGRRGLLVDGVLFAPMQLRDLPDLPLGKLAVHHVERGSVGEAQEIDKSDLLEAVDGSPVDSLEELERRLRAARSENRSAAVTFKRLASESALFAWVERALPVGQILVVEHDATERAGASPAK